jgi:hypothetical protein
MRDIPETFLALLSSDAALRSLLGIGIDVDPRIYLYYNSNAEVDEERGLKAFITYALVGRGAQSGGMVAPVYSFAIWGRDQDIVEQVRDRLVDLLDKKALNTGVRTVYGKVVQENDSFQEQPNFGGKTLHFRFGFLQLSEAS